MTIQEHTAINRDKEIVQELARQVLDLSSLEINQKRKDRLRAVNDLHTGLRPGVWLNEIPWHEMDIDGKLVLHCTDPFAREMEQYFRRILFRWEYFQADMVVEGFYPIEKSYESTGNGLGIQEDVRRTDEYNNIVSHSYHDVLDTEEKLAKLHPPVLTAHPEIDCRNRAAAEELLGGTMPVRLMGTQIYYAPWDDIAILRGVEPILYDMMDRPEFLHQIIAGYTANQDSLMTQLEELGLLEDELTELHCTPAYTDDLPKAGSGESVRLKNVWFRSMAQMFSTVSPAMHDEFELEYMRPLMARCGLVYYGCCEPLDNKISLLKTIPNMRKIGVSPWADIESCAEQLGSDYVYARKPNPAFVAGEFDEDVVRKEIEDTVRVCIRYRCPYEFVLKDISTVSQHPENLIKWTRTVQETLDRYYG